MNVLNTAVGTAADEALLDDLALDGLVTLKASVLHGPGDCRPPPLVVSLGVDFGGQRPWSAMNSVDVQGLFQGAMETPAR